MPTATPNDDLNELHIHLIKTFWKKDRHNVPSIKRDNLSNTPTLLKALTTPVIKIIPSTRYYTEVLIIPL